MLTALVVDDFEPFRRFVCSKLESRPDLQVIGEASDGLEAVEKAQALKPDLILLDIGLPSLNGIEAASYIPAHSKHDNPLCKSDQRCGCGSGSFKQRSEGIRLEAGRGHRPAACGSSCSTRSALCQ